MIYNELKDSSTQRYLKKYAILISNKEHSYFKIYVAKNLSSMNEVLFVP